MIKQPNSNHQASNILLTPEEVEVPCVTTSLQLGGRMNRSHQSIQRQRVPKLVSGNRNRGAPETDEPPPFSVPGTGINRNKETLIQPHDEIDKDGERETGGKGEGTERRETELTADGKSLGSFPRSATDLPSSLTEPWPAVGSNLEGRMKAGSAPAAASAWRSGDG
ncbi:hypothetical protein PR202_ga02445 [Eleusine coracana subsp. coracana]|uniref:Uncharacterized protein n=1 Tax=Eleusine coracana subsp. coracana TaxID=191504 RepID=A0AAV5BMU0_ELECO|nr:hypothetical protein PR202_ga02445 [Eleusine coracana subsp. coracana]